MEAQKANDKDNHYGIPKISQATHGLVLINSFNFS
jgi:hypothetical protein